MPAVIYAAIVPGSTTIISLPRVKEGGTLSLGTDFLRGVVRIAVGKAKPQPNAQNLPPDGLDVHVLGEYVGVGFGQLMYDADENGNPYRYDANGNRTGDSTGAVKTYSTIPIAHDDEVISIIQMGGGPMAAVVEIS